MSFPFTVLSFNLWTLFKFMTFFQIHEYALDSETFFIFEKPFKTIFFKVTSISFQSHHFLRGFSPLSMQSSLQCSHSCIDRHVLDCKHPIIPFTWRRSERFQFNMDVGLVAHCSGFTVNNLTDGSGWCLRITRSYHGSQSWKRPSGLLQAASVPGQCSSLFLISKVIQFPGYCV